MFKKPTANYRPWPTHLFYRYWLLMIPVEDLTQMQSKNLRHKWLNYGFVKPR